MNTSRFASISSSLLMAVLAAPSTLLAQETVEITGRDQGIDANFEEVYSVGVLEGESWEMFGQVAKVAFDAEGNLFVFDDLGSRTHRARLRSCRPWGTRSGCRLFCVQSWRPRKASPIPRHS